MNLVKRTASFFSELYKHIQTKKHKKQIELNENTTSSFKKMKWVKEVPKISAYYWAKYKDEDDWLDGIPEIVYLCFNGHWYVYRPGYLNKFPVTDFVAWSNKYIENKELEDEQTN